MERAIEYVMSFYKIGRETAILYYLDEIIAYNRVFGGLK